ncbi:MAG TPA: HlyD family efflux transporter periplasmic adaptor subunit [Amycolatopsis sp.]|uniref:efflux RND transporter periplasmic adaptor subunit n=1 Tax=Amycolatopsis sp. TaxID=37632 RepID=UPI002B46B91F|nr:HlyD family efflux transporter periplasmic adaptor subunit [Amycolatopsis sp.]HKS49501.1 HlyD family efflux transporter periplasmic adaptor subunit [Amycolatopsis sp.]
MGKRLRRILLLVAVLLIAGGGAAVWASTGSPAPGYRTAVAGPASVRATLEGTGTIEPVSQATMSFPTSGQVASIPVQVGQQVTTGQPLVQLDTTSPAGQVASAQSTLASAQAKLAADQSGQTSATTSGSGRVTPALYVTGTSAPSADLKSQQDAVTSAQHQVDLDLTAATAALAEQQKACQPIVQPSTQKTATTTPPTQNDVDACTTAIQQAQDAQHTTAVDEQKLADAENALSETLAKGASSRQPEPKAATPTTPTPPKSGGTSSRSGGSPSKSGNGSSGTTKTVTISPEQLAADQASIDAANAQVSVAQQNLAAATLVSPIDGTVAQIGFTVGQPASGQHIVVIGPGADQVTTAVSDTQAGQIKPGQPASVTPDGSGTPITGQVTAIGLLSTTTSSGSPSYPVTISLPSSARQLFPGATASVSIVTSSAEAAVTVPTSAVHLQGAAATVTVLVNDQPEVRRVTVGVVGAAATEVLSGLRAGEQVVLADLSQPLPTSNTTNRGLTGGGGGGVRVGAGGQGGGPGR